MKAVVLAGGAGTRLRPLTYNLPKPMVPILNRPFLERLLLRLKAYDVTDVALTLWYLQDVIQARLGHGESLDVRLSYVVEEEPLGTAGAIKNLEPMLDETFFAFNGDIFTDLDLAEVLRFHRDRGAVATIVLTPVEDPRAYGVVEADSTGRVKRFTEKPSLEDVRTLWVNAGTYILEPRVLDQIPGSQHVMFERDIFPALLEQGLPVYAYRSRSYWIDVGTPESYRRLHHDLLLGGVGLFPEAAWLEGDVQIGEGCRVAGDVVLRPPVVLGEGCVVESGAQVLGPTVLGPGCSLGRGAIVDRAILWDGVHLGSNSTVSRCILARGAAVAEDVSIGEGCIIGDEAVVGPGNHLGEGISLWPGKHLEGATVTRAQIR